MDKLNSHATYGINFYGDVGCTGTSPPTNTELMECINGLIDEIKDLKIKHEELYEEFYNHKNYRHRSNEEN